MKGAYTMEQPIPCNTGKYMIPTIIAETYEQSVEIEKELLAQGFRFLKVEGRRMMYSRSTLKDIGRVYVLMKFWENE